MFGKIIALAALAALTCPAATQAQTGPVDEVFQEWLAAFNSGEKPAIQAFYGDRLGDPQAAFALDNAQATCGFDPVRVEARAARSMTVLLAERCFPALQRLQIELGPEGESRLAKFLLLPFALTVDAANNAVAALADRMAARDELAGSLLIAQDGAPLLARSWGTLEGDGGPPITLDTPMYLASAGKMFTAVAVLQLADAGKVELDAPLGTYLADYPNAEMAGATIRQLLQHRGGAGDTGILGREDGDNRARVRSIADIIALNGERAPGFPPGTQTAYSNYGFVLLGAEIERVSGESYYDYVARHVFAPAGMAGAAYPDKNHRQGVATGLTNFYGEESALESNVPILPWRGMPDGGGVASANDLLKFFKAMRSGELLSPAMFELATSAGETPWYGMGFVVSTVPYSSWGHGGNSYGMDVAAHSYPAVDGDFICLATRDMACNRLIWAWVPKVHGLTE